MPDKPSDWFARERVVSAESATVVLKSTCKKCGKTITGNILDGLAKKEEQHIKACPSASTQ